VALQRWYKPNMGTTPKTYLYHALRSKFTDLIHASCKHVGKKSLYNEDEEMDDDFHTIPSKTPSPVNVMILEEKYDSLTSQEKMYIHLILSKGTTNTISLMAQIRRDMQINPQEEREIKQSIYEKMLG